MSTRDYILTRASMEPNSGCWLWMGSVNEKDYGLARLGGKNVKAHRLAYEVFVGPVPDGLVLDHLCRVRCCVNPAHLEPVTQAENIRRAVSISLTGWGAYNRIKTHCGRGHKYSELNTYVQPNGGRYCKECRRVSSRAYKKLQREAA